MNYFSYHTHSSFCDGKASMKEMCEAAMKQKLEAVGFSSHAPVPFNTTWAMSFESLKEYVEESEKCKQQYKNDLQIYRSLEADYISNDLSVTFETWRRMAKLDYIIGSVHLVASQKYPGEIWFLDGPASNYEEGLRRCFDGDIQAAVTQYFKQLIKMVETQQPDVVAHMDKVVMNNQERFFTSSDDWYIQLVYQALEVMAKHNTIVEVNTRGWYKGKYHTWFPEERYIRKCAELGIPLTVSVDAHHPDELKAGFNEAAEAIRQAGAKEISVFNGEGWEQITI